MARVIDTRALIFIFSSIEASMSMSPYGLWFQLAAGIIHSHVTILLSTRTEISTWIYCAQKLVQITVCKLILILLTGLVIVD